MNTLPQLRPFLIVATVGALAFAGAASAAPGPSSPTTVAQVVRISDLDLNSVSGAQRLAFRLKVAANHVCGGDNPLLHSGDVTSCRQAAIARAIDGLDAPLVSEALGIAPQASSLARR